jgi:SHS2 domain-containing protein
MPQGYRFLDHTADLGVEIWGPDAIRLFEQAAVVLRDLLVKAADEKADHTDTLEIDGQDWADLMVNWLRELLHLFVGRERVVTGVRIEDLCDTRLKAEVDSVRFDPLVHRPNHEIKAVTYHQIDVGPVEEGWRAMVIFDV